MTDDAMVLVRSEDLAEYLGRTDVVVMVIDQHVLELPQFGLAVDVEVGDEGAVADATSRLVKQLLAHHVALTELDDEYVNEQEAGQLALMHEVFIPWLVRQMAGNPSYFEIPPVRMHPRGQGRRQTSTA